MIIKKAYDVLKKDNVLFNNTVFQYIIKMSKLLSCLRNLFCTNATFSN